MLNKVRNILFFSIVFFTSSQVGFHFWPGFSKISGIRVDYLSPTVYLLDVLIIIWIALYLVRGVKENWNVKIKSPTFRVFLILFALGLVLNIFVARSPHAHLFGSVKLLEFVLFGLLVAKTFKKKDAPIFVSVLAFSGIVSAILAIWQFINQSSAGGIWYFFGERTFNISTIGISTVNLNRQILRPYGAFPHPNILAFFLLTTIIFTTMRIPHERNNYIKILFIAAIIFSSIALILTFSRIAIALFICFLFYAIYTKQKANIRRYLLCGLGMLVLAGIYYVNEIGSTFLLRGIDFRSELTAQSFAILQNNLYFGIGLNNFFIHQAPLIREISPILFQPPHNIFVIALLSFGIFGWWIFPATLMFAIRSLLNKLKTTNEESRDFYQAVLFILISIIVVGMFDHFFLTLEQGQIMLALILGMSFSDLKIKS